MVTALSAMVIEKCASFGCARWRAHKSVKEAQTQWQLKQREQEPNKTLAFYRIRVSKIRRPNWFWLGSSRVLKLTHPKAWKDPAYYSFMICWVRSPFQNLWDAWLYAAHFMQNWNFFEKRRTSLKSHCAWYTKSELTNQIDKTNIQWDFYSGLITEDDDIFFFLVNSFICPI